MVRRTFPRAHALTHTHGLAEDIENPPPLTHAADASALTLRRATDRFGPSPASPASSP